MSIYGVAVFYISAAMQSPVSVLSQVLCIRAGIALAYEEVAVSQHEIWAKAATLFWNYGTSETLMVLCGKISATDQHS